MDTVNKERRPLAVRGYQVSLMPNWWTLGKRVMQMADSPVSSQQQCLFPSDPELCRGTNSCEKPAHKACLPVSAHVCWCRGSLYLFAGDCYLHNISCMIVMTPWLSLPFWGLPSTPACISGANRQCTPCQHILECFLEVEKEGQVYSTSRGSGQLRCSSVLSGGRLDVLESNSEIDA